MAQQKLLAPNETVWWLDLANAPADLNDIDEDHLNVEAVNLSCAIAAGGTLGPTDPQMDTSKTICDEGNVDTPIDNQYEGNLTFFRDKNLEENASVFNHAFQLFKSGGKQGFLVRRIGAKSSMPAVADELVEVFGFEADLPKSIDGGDNPPPVQYTVKFIPSGVLTGLIPVKAGA